MTFLIVTGLSGAGKSQAMRALEDIGYYCVDNMPPKLLPKFAELCMQSNEGLYRVAIAVDSRGGEQLSDLFDNLQELTAMGGVYSILYLECDDAVISRRYKETRRQHPLAYTVGCTLQEAIAQERALLADVRERTDFLLDTSYFSTSQLKKRIIDLFSEEPIDTMLVECMSFGFKYGYPLEADLVFDVRCFPNPFYVAELKGLTGLDESVRDFVLSGEEIQVYLTHLYALIDYLLPLYRAEGKSRLVIAIGCTGGKHRSVAVSEELARHITPLCGRIQRNHRDINKT